MAAIVAVHALAFYALAQSRLEQAKSAPAAVAVVLVAETPKPEPLSTPDPIVAVQLVTQPQPLLDLPSVEVEVQTNIPSPNAITVAPPKSAPLASSAPSEGPVLLSTVEYLKPPRPRYPHGPKRRRTEGLVMVRAIIDESGNPRDVVVERSSGDRELDDAAREAVCRALFKPYAENGRPRLAVVVVPIEFALRVRSARHDRRELAEG